MWTYGRLWFVGARTVARVVRAYVSERMRARSGLKRIWLCECNCLCECMRMFRRVPLIQKRIVYPDNTPISIGLHIMLLLVCFFNDCSE